MCGGAVVSIETLIRFAKFNYKTSARPEDINKIQTAFPRSGMHRVCALSITWSGVFCLLVY